jgi:hypothetical protein
MATHDRTGPSRWVHGSAAEAVVSRASIPVMVVRAAEGPRPARRFDQPRPVLVVPLDGSAFAEAALPIAYLRRVHRPRDRITAESGAARRASDLGRGARRRTAERAMGLGMCRVQRQHSVDEHWAPEWQPRLATAVLLNPAVRPKAETRAGSFGDRE